MGMPGSAEGLISVGGIIYSRRVTGEYAPWVVRLCVAWLFPAGLVGGIAAGCLQTARQRLITLVPFIPGLLVSAVTSSRANLVALFCCWIGAFIAVRLAATAGNYRLTTPKRLLQVAAVAAIFAVFFLTFGWLRSYFYGKEMKTDIDVPFAQAYFVGSVASFGDWVQGEIDFDRRGSLGLGAYTLVPGLLDLLGVKEREVGVTAEFTHIGYGQVSNVYTAFRGLVEDFSLPGSAVFLFFTGLLCGSAYRANMTGGIRGWPILVLAAFYGCTIYSPLVSLFVYNSIHLAWFVAALLMVRCHQVAGSTRNRPEYSEKFREAAARLEQRRDAGGGPRGTRIAVTERN
jgi:oligosaccharide repeat unit polymerase